MKVRFTVVMTKADLVPPNELAQRCMLTTEQVAGFR
jgi:hypothetical protein